MLQRFRDRIVNIWVAGGIIGLIAITFIFWGVDFNLGGASYAARVNGDEIALREFDREFQNELFDYQEMYQSDIDAALRTELRRNVLERMIELRAMQQRIRETGYYVSDDRVIQYIASIPLFQADGRFSPDIYRAQLRFQGFTPAGFEAQQRMQLEIMEFRNGLFDSTFLTPSEFRRYIELYFQQRELSYALFPIDSFIDLVEVDEEAVALHYNANRDRYRTPEAVELEFLEVRMSDIAAEIDVTEQMLVDYYERNRDRFETVEERRARHVLIAVGANGEAAARASAEEALERIRAGEDFAAVAAEMSDDVGTRNAGGDLGWVPRGMLGDAFEAALYELDMGEVSEPVRSSFGYHVIRLDNVRAGDTVPFESIRDELAEDFARDLAEDRYFELANDLADRAFDAYDQLGTVASQTGLNLRVLERFTRAGDNEAFDNSAQVVQAAFGRESLERRINSNMLELSDDQVVVVRVRDHFPPAERPLDEVYDEIVAELTRMRAEELARQAANEFHAEARDMAVADLLAAARDALSPPPVSIGDDEEAADDSAADDAASDATAADVDEEAQAAHALAALAERLGGTWVGPRWVEQAAADVPTQIMASAFTMPRLREGDAPRDERVSLASGDQAVLFVSGHRPGQPPAIPQQERDFLQQELADRAAVEEMLAYAGAVREQARVRIPAGVLDDPDYLLD